MSEVEDIVRAILEGEDEDFKDLASPDPEGMWEQVGGDFGDPWVYGGTFWNEVKRELLHFDGIENEKEIEPENVEVPPYTLEKIKRIVHDPDLDQDWAQEDPAWLEKQLKDEEREIERKVGEYQYAKAAFLNARKPYRWEQVDVVDALSTTLQHYVPSVKEQFDEATASEFDTWPVHIQTAEILNYAGWDHFADVSYTMTKKEASFTLGMSL